MTFGNRALLLALIVAPALARAKLSPEISLSDDGTTLNVSFVSGHASCTYNMVARSVFAHDAKITVHTERGAHQQLPSGDLIFISRKPGAFATAILDDSNTSHDKKVSGLFLCDDVLIDIPAVARNTGMGDAKLKPKLELVNGVGKQHRRLSQRRLAGTFVQGHVPQIANETGDWDVPPDPAAYVASASDEWNGAKWWPGCYSGDQELHVFKLGVIIDVEAVRKHGDGLNSMIRDTVARASFIYENQMNIRLEIGTLRIHKSPDDPDTPAYARGTCEGYPGYDGIKNQLQQMNEQELDLEASHGAVQLFTGCGDGKGYVGVGYVNAICQHMDVTVVELHDSMAWLIFAHELGHNFGADHSFEEGKGTTGGIMDYNTGSGTKIDGVYQFNTKYRKQQMCAVMNEGVGRCGDSFRVCSEGDAACASDFVLLAGFNPIRPGVLFVVMLVIILFASGQLLGQGIKDTD